MILRVSTRACEMFFLFWIYIFLGLVSRAGAVNVDNCTLCSGGTYSNATGQLEALVYNKNQSGVLRARLTTLTRIWPIYKFCLKSAVTCSMPNYVSYMEFRVSLLVF